VPGHVDQTAEARQGGRLCLGVAASRGSPEQHRGLAGAEPGIGGGRVQTRRARRRLEGLVVATQGTQRNYPAQLDLAMPGRGAGGTLEMGQGFGLPELAQRHAAVVVQGDPVGGLGAADAQQIGSPVQGSGHLLPVRDPDGRQHDEPWPPASDSRRGPGGCQPIV
jgi:hypothetical protein